MRCKQAKKLISLYLAPHTSGLSVKDRHALEAHLAACEPCRRDYEEGQEAVALLRRYWHISEDTRALLRGTRQQGQDGSSGPVLRLRTPFHRVAAWALATAACLAIGALGWRVTAGPRTLMTGSGGPVASSGTDAPLRIESMDNGRRILPGAVIQTSAGETRSLVLNARHQVVMNAGTRLSVEPLMAKGRTGCLVHLALGEVYVHVEHDGNPFVLQTDHGRAVITGTTFDVRATDAGTTLVVAEGSVRFESQSGFVQVNAGQQSMIARTWGAPGMPTPCDSAGLTVWAHTTSRERQIAQDIPRDDFLWDDLPATPSPWARVQTDPDQIDSAQWIEQERNWFQQQFPWIFELRKALRKEGIEADYPVLLVQSGDIWRFAYPPADLGRQVQPDPNGLLRAASHYGYDKSWLQRYAVASLQATSPPPPRADTEAFERWIRTVQVQADLRPSKVDSGTLLDTVNTCTYLAHTRTLTILVIRNGLHGPSSQAQKEVVGLLQEELRTLARCVELSRELDWARSDAGTCENLDRLSSLIAGIREIHELEKRVKEHENVLVP